MGWTTVAGASFIAAEELKRTRLGAARRARRARKDMVVTGGRLKVCAEPQMSDYRDPVSEQTRKLFLQQTMVARHQSSAQGVLALLSEPGAIFKQHALKALNPLVPQFWAEISEHIALM